MRIYDITMHDKFQNLLTYIAFVTLFDIFPKQKLCYKFLVRLHGEYNIL